MKRSRELLAELFWQQTSGAGMKWIHCYWELIGQDHTADGLLLVRTLNIVKVDG